MQFKRHIMMTSAVASLAMGLSMTAGVAAVHAQASTAPASSDTVIVTGIRKSLQSSLKQKRDADSVEEVITAEDVGKFPDKNVADSLSRATGVNVVTGSAAAGGFGENEHISIRGTDPNLNLTLMDGHNMATGDWFVQDQQAGGRSFNYTMLPSEVVGTIEIIKSSSADLSEGGMGGTVDVHVRNPLDLKPNTFAASAQALYASLPGKTTPNVSGMYSWRNDARTLGVLVGAYYEAREFRRDGQEVLGYTGISNFAGTGKTVYMPSLIGSEYFTQKRTREGVNLNVQWKASDRLEFDVSGLYTHLQADNNNHNYMFWGSKLAGAAQGGGYFSTTYLPSNYTTQDVDGTTYLTSGTWTKAQVQAASAESHAAGQAFGSLVQDDIVRKAHSDSYDINVDMKWHATDKLTITGQLGYTAGEGVTDDSAAWETYWDNTGASFKLGNPTSTVAYPDLPTDKTSSAYLSNKFNWSWGANVKSPDKETYAKVDFTYLLDNSIFKDVKFGARYTDHRRDMDFIAYSWGGNGVYSQTGGINLGTVYAGESTPGDYGQDVGNIPGYTFGSASSIFNYEDTHNGGRVFGFYAPASFAVHETTDAYYAMTHLGGDSWKGNIGVRAVHTKTTSIQYTTNVAAGTSTTPSVFGAYAEIDSAHDYWDFLPSANLTYKVNSDVIIRAAAAEVMTRPGYAQLAGAYSLNDANHTGTAGGNPDLDPYKAWQYNLGVEYYYAPQAMVSFTAFKIDFSNYITTNVFSATFVDQQNPTGASFQMQGPANGGKGNVDGYEVSLQQPIGEGFGFIANATYANGKGSDGGPMDGNSKWTYNLTGYFENSLVSARLAYNYRSKFKSGTDRGTAMWQDNYGTLDGSFSYNLSSNIALTLDAQNLTHQKLYYFVGNPSIPRAYYDNGQSWFVGVRLKY
ncbi:TonB-dependent receptor [Asticcacaulis solisilvae]|uniref:TonB-dependent receptor n=1 Tax=Asticcacaulis solisilvae TaxID=1217274 RepID=UPI003FD88CAB